MIKFLKYLYQFFLTINIYEYKLSNKKNFKKKTQIFFVKSISQAKINKSTIEYFKKYKLKFKRFKNKSKFIGLKHKNKLICSGWIYFGNNCKWNIEEINKKISLNGECVLYDFETEKQFRNRGYYQLLLKIIQNKLGNHQGF